MKRVVIIDNYDSFTHNLYQLIGGLGAEVAVHRNDGVTVEALHEWAPSHVVLSPGPGHPGVARDFGICPQVIDHFAHRVPTLGVCLGHQGIAHHLGGEVGRADAIIHGKTDLITHIGEGLFSGLPQPLEVMRYHSLAVSAAHLPSCLQVTAQTSDGVVMAIRHRTWPLVGVQFHPESIGTPSGASLMNNFLDMEAA